MPVNSTSELHVPDTVARTHRLESIDWLRGFVMVIMTLDHVRDFFSPSGPDPLTDPNVTAALFATRWVTHLCAPTFVLLAGVSIGLMLKRRTAKVLSRFLLSRGLWLIFLEATVVTFAWKFNFSNSPGAVIFQVIWAIGVAMLLLAGVIHLPRSAALAIGITLVAGTNLLDGLLPAGGIQSLKPFWLSIHRQILTAPGGIQILILYPILAWTGVMTCGYVLAPIFSWESRRRQLFLARLGGGLLTLFIFLRLLDVYGDPNPWLPGDNWGRTLMNFLNVEKYPPSMLFLVATIGIALLLLALVERWRSPLHNAFVTIGRVPLLYYVAHLYAAHLLAVAAGMLMGLPPSAWLADPFMNKPAGYGFGLPVVYSVWIGVVLALYPVCRWFARLKAQRKDWWLSYL
ncbi:MAG: heparan-alpha-glucosaminide N-acetyltransferase domain-containing protein [Desulfobulbaceae bacterium]|nr:heparan-alpha-glucosaminide N-acetyltransferase domain-containing protein [Desulfobulbaceae bacterium]